MLKSYLILAFRNLGRNKSYSAINIAGLGVSIAACILIGLFVHNEISFDKNIAHKENIYRLNEYIHYDGTAPQLAAASAPPIASFLSENHPEIQAFTRLYPATPFIYTSITLEYGGKKITNPQMACTDTTFADMFGVTFLEGDKGNFIRGSNSIVLTQSMARKIFGNENALNKSIALHTNDTTLYVAVSNVIADLPSTSHIQVEGLLPIPDHFGYNLESNYGVILGPTYLRLKAKTPINELQTAFTKTIHAKNKFIDMQLQRLDEVHARSMAINYDYFNYKKIDGKYIKIFIIIALAIFIIACINFINLTIAIAGYRGKEIAIKKIIGAKRSHIVLQVMTETFLSVLLAVILAVLLAATFLPWLNTILDRELIINTLYQPVLLGIYAAALLITTFIAGAYPAWLISSSKANQVLKSKSLTGGSRAVLRNVLVTGQFVIAVVFIISLLVFLKQLNFIQKKDLGYSYNQVIKIPLEVTAADKLVVLRAELLKVKGVNDVTNGYMEFGSNGSLFGIDYMAPDGQNKHISVNFENALPNYVSFFGMKIVAGQNFGTGNAANQYLINETLAKQIGYANPIGKQINLSSFPAGTVIGVVKDFNYSSLHAGIEPLLISSIDNVPVWQSQFYIKVAAADISTTLRSIQTVLKTITGNDNNSYQFMDEHFKEVYRSERQAGTMIAIIGGLAISIACLGLLSLAAFMIMRRTKEIGIRKVVGASAVDITVLLSKDFLKLVLISFLLAFPVAGWAMHAWLQGFAYRIQIGVDVFLIAGFSIVFITLFTISFQAIRASLANPVKSLRTD